MKEKTLVTAKIERPGEVEAIYPAMQAVMKGLASIPKNGRMSFGNTSYEYLKADDVQEKLNPLLVENNVIVNAQYEVRDVVKGNRNWVYVDLALTYISSVDGSRFPTVTATGESIAGDDKSVNKALTQAIKNAHRATFQFASGEPEPDDAPPASPAASTPAQRQVERARSGPKPTTAPKPKPAPAPKPVPEDALKEKVRQAIDAGEVTSEQANRVWEEIVKETGKPRAEVLPLVIERLGI